MNKDEAETVAEMLTVVTDVHHVAEMARPGSLIYFVVPQAAGRGRPHVNVESAAKWLADWKAVQ